MVALFDKQVSRWSSQTLRWDLSASRCGHSATREQSHCGVNMSEQAASHSKCMKRRVCVEFTHMEVHTDVVEWSSESRLLVICPETHKRMTFTVFPLFLFNSLFLVHFLLFYMWWFEKHLYYSIYLLYHLYFSLKTAQLLIQLSCVSVKSLVMSDSYQNTFSHWYLHTLSACLCLGPPNCICRAISSTFQEALNHKFTVVQKRMLCFNHECSGARWEEGWWW